MKELGKWFNPKVTISIIAIIAAILIYLKFKGVSLFSEVRKKVNVNPFKTTKNADQLENIANIQYVAMSIIGTDEESLFNSLKGLSPDDLKSIYNRFGQREYLAFGSANQVIVGDSLDLFEWYLQELSGRTLEKMRKIWEPTGLIF